MSAGVLDLSAERWTPFSRTIDFVGLDFTGLTFKAQIRAYRDASGDPLVDLTNAASPAEGISVTVAVVDSVTVSTLQIRINETTIEGLAFTNPRGGDLPLTWDLHVGTGAAKKRWLQGTFTVMAGVTQ